VKSNIIVNVSLLIMNCRNCRSEETADTWSLVFYMTTHASHALLLAIRCVSSYVHINVGLTKLCLPAGVVGKEVLIACNTLTTRTYLKKKRWYLRVRSVSLALGETFVSFDGGRCGRLRVQKEPYITNLITIEDFAW